MFSHCDVESLAGLPHQFKSAFAIVMANDIGAAITPTAVGGGPVKIGMLVNKGMPAPKATFYGFVVSTEDIIFTARVLYWRYSTCNHVIEQLLGIFTKTSIIAD